MDSVDTQALITTGPTNTFKAMFQLIWKYKSLMINRMMDKSVHVYKYGNKRRQTMDIYLPSIDNTKQKNKKHPCFILSIGSGWMFGHKFFGIPFGYLGQKLGYITVVIDYNRYPFSSVNNQITDCTKAVNWVFNNIETNYNGDINRINIATYSAAGHIVLKALFKQLHNKDSNSWKPNNINSLFLCSCPFDLEAIYKSHKNHKALVYCMNNIFALNHNNNSYALRQHCVTYELKQMIEKNEINPSDMPPIYIANGDKDTTCHFKSAFKFYKMLKNHGFTTRLHSINGWNHLDFAFKDVTPLAWYMHSYVSDDNNPFVNDGILTEYF
eukprot:366399_1